MTHVDVEQVIGLEALAIPYDERNPELGVKVKVLTKDRDGKVHARMFVPSLRIEASSPELEGYVVDVDHQPIGGVILPGPFTFRKK